MELVRKDIVRIQNGVHSYLTSRKKPRLKRAVILLHGAGGGAWYWEEYINYFTTVGGYPTYAADLRGHGARVEENILNASIIDYVDDLAGWIQNDIMPKHDGLVPTILGHSMGGLIAQKLAERNFAHKMILLAPVPPKGIPMVFGRDFKVPIRDYITAGFVGSFRPSRKLVKSLFVEPEKNKEMIERCIEQRLHESPRALYELLENKVAIDRKKVTVPMLVIGFIRDHIITEHVVRRIGQYYGAVPATPEDPKPFRELQIRADLGHLCPLEHEWERVAKKCVDWIA